MGVSWTCICGSGCTQLVVGPDVRRTLVGCSTFFSSHLFLLSLFLSLWFAPSTMGATHAGARTVSFEFLAHSGGVPLRGQSAGWGIASPQDER